MNIVGCDICKREIRKGFSDKPEYCDRCKPLGDEFRTELAKIAADAEKALEQSINRLRNTYTQRIALQQKASIKAVQNA